MKYVLLVTLLSSGTPTAVTMQQFGSRNACEAAAFEASHTCSNINIDGGGMKVCAAHPNVQAKCLRYSLRRDALYPYQVVSNVTDNP